MQSGIGPTLSWGPPQSPHRQQPLLAQTPQSTYQQAPTIQAPQPLRQEPLSAETPQSATQQPMSVQTRPDSDRQLLAVQNPQMPTEHHPAGTAQTPTAPLGEGVDADNEDNEDEYEQDLAEEGATNGDKQRRAQGQQFGSTGKGKYATLVAKWDAEARAKGYDPTKPASGANPWAGFVEGVGIGGGEDRG